MIAQLLEPECLRGCDFAGVHLDCGPCHTTDFVVVIAQVPNRFPPKIQGLLACQFLLGLLVALVVESSSEREKALGAALRISI